MLQISPRGHLLPALIKKTDILPDLIFMDRQTFPRSRSERLTYREKSVSILAVLCEIPCGEYTPLESVVASQI